LLLKSGADPLLVGKDGTTCLIAATRYGNPSETIKVREGAREGGSKGAQWDKRRGKEKRQIEMSDARRKNNPTNNRKWNAVTDTLISFKYFLIWAYLSHTTQALLAFRPSVPPSLFLNATDRQGWSVLHWLCSRKEAPDILRSLSFLLAAGVNVNLKNNRRLTALEAVLLAQGMNSSSSSSNSSSGSSSSSSSGSSKKRSKIEKRLREGGREGGKKRRRYRC